MSDFNLCRAMPSLCTGHLGIARCDMPQLPRIDAKIDRVLRGRHIDWMDVTTPVDELTPTQGDLSANIVTKMVDDVLSGEWRDEQGPWSSNIVITEDGHILDGHHRWAASKILETSDEPRIRDWRERHDTDVIRLHATRLQSSCSDGRANISNVLAILNKVHDIEHTKCGTRPDEVACSTPSPPSRSPSRLFRRR